MARFGVTTFVMVSLSNHDLDRLRVTHRVQLSKRQAQGDMARFGVTTFVMVSLSNHDPSKAQGDMARLRVTWRGSG